MIIRNILYILRAIGLSGIARTIYYGVQRDRANKLVGNKPPGRIYVNPGTLSTVNYIPGGIEAVFENASLQIIFLSENMILISWEPGIAPIPYTIAKNDWKIVTPEHKINRADHSLTFGNLKIVFDTQGNIRIVNLQGKLLKHDHPPMRKGDQWILSTELFPEEHIYGLGERAGKLDLRPGNYTSWNTDPGGNYSQGTDPLYIGTPIYLSLSTTGNQLVYFENSYRADFRIADTLEAEFSGGMLRYYLIFGSLEEIYTKLGELVGRPFMPPRWVFGYHQSRWSYRNETEVRELVKEFEGHDLPLSAIHLDIDYMDQFKVFTINDASFPSLKQLTGFLAMKGIKTVVSLNPAVKVDRNFDIYNDGKSKDVFCKLPNGEIFHGVSWPGWSVFPDFTKPDVRKWWREQYHYLTSEGISGIWHDMNEPASFAAWGDKSFPLSTQHFMEGRGGNHEEAHNLYGLLMNQAGYEALRVNSPDKRPWILSRSGWAGLQRYAWNWTADTNTSWESLQQTIPTILGLGLSGHAFSGVDIGGFSGDPDAELYLRWFQLAAFLPLFRTHSSIVTKPREPWVYGEPTTSIIRKYLKLRYKLLPYLYTLAWDSAQTGIPPLRPLFWNNPTDIQFMDVQDEFLLGDALLLAPILHKGERSRPIILPPGKWYSFGDNLSHIGDKQFIYPAALSTIPFFVKEGTILPMEENGGICYHIYPGEDIVSESHKYTDVGDGYGSWRVDRFQISNNPNLLDISWSYEGNFPFPYAENKYQVHGKNLVNAVCDGKQYTIQDNSFITPYARRLLLHLE